MIAVIVASVLGTLLVALAVVALYQSARISVLQEELLDDSMVKHEQRLKERWRRWSMEANVRKAKWRKKARERKLRIAQLERDLQAREQEAHWATVGYHSLLDAIHQRTVIKTEGDVLDELTAAISLRDAIQAGQAQLLLLPPR